MSLKKTLSRSILFQIYVGLTFFITGLLINFVQLILYNTLYYVNVTLYRKINYYLTYCVWSQIVALADWWADTEYTIYFADEESKKQMCKKHTIFLMNHTYEIDWIMAWLAIDRFNNLALAKSFVKKSLRWIPVVGWGWIFSELAFLERDFNKDSKKIVKSLQKYLEYPDPTSLLLFAEGTRFTKAKHENSIEFAKQRNLPILKHHLLPRTKGFDLCVKSFKDEKNDMMVAQTELCFTNDSSPPTFMSLAKCRPLRANVYIRFIPMNKIPSETDEATANFLYDFYKEKDELIEYHKKYDKFPGIEVKLAPRLSCLLNWMFWLSLSALLIPFLLYQLVFHGSWLLIGIVISIILFGIASLLFMIRSTKIKKSSSYGVKDSKKKE